MRYIIIICLIFVVFAVFKESTERRDAYIFGKPKKTDRTSVLMRKIRYAAGYEQNTVKWRRIYLLTIFQILLVFGIVYKRTPTRQEFILIGALLFGSSYSMYKAWYPLVGKEALFEVDECLKLIKLPK